MEVLSSIPALLGSRQGYILDESPVQGNRITVKQSQLQKKVQHVWKRHVAKELHPGPHTESNHLHSHSHLQTMLPISLMCISLEWGLEYLELTQTQGGPRNPQSSCCEPTLITTAPLFHFLPLKFEVRHKINAGAWLKEDANGHTKRGQEQQHDFKRNLFPVFSVVSFMLYCTGEKF